MFRSVLVILAAAALAAPSGVSARPAHKPRPAPPASSAPASGADAAEEAAPMPAYGGLASLTEQEARARLGPPDIARAEGSGAMWTYRLRDCALFVFFRGAAGQPLRVSGAADGPRRRGDPPAPLETCIAEASQPR